MNGLALDFHGTRVGLLCADAALRDEFRRDFAYFAAAPGAEPAIRLEVRLEPAASPPPRAALRWRSARIGQSGGLRRVDYEGRASLEYDLARERGVLRGEDRALLHELGYLTILSRAGNALDLAGLHRVHALGFSHRGRGGLVLLPMNGGKSRLALELLGREGFELLSDDTPLLDAATGDLVAFPLSLSLRGDDARGIPRDRLRVFPRRRFGAKQLVDLDHFPGRVRARAPLEWLLLGDRDGRETPGFAPCSRAAAAAALAAPLVLGADTPQVLELMLPPPPFLPGAWTLAAIAARRAAAGLRAASRAKTARFHLGRDPRSNADALRAFLKEAKTAPAVRP